MRAGRVSESSQRPPVQRIVRVHRRLAPPVDKFREISRRIVAVGFDVRKRIGPGGIQFSMKTRKSKAPPVTRRDRWGTLKFQIKTQATRPLDSFSA